MQNKLQISLRETSEVDSDAVYNLKKAAFSHYVKKQFGTWDEAEQRDYHLARFAPNDIKIITVDRHVVGFVSVVSESDHIMVNQLIIHPKHQSKGIGAHCMELIKRRAKGIGLPVRLQVMKVNPRAMNFYQRVGFVMTGETKTHYQMELLPYKPCNTIV